MKIVPIIKNGNENSLGEFIAGDHVFAGLKRFPKNDTFKYGLVSCLWVFSSKLDSEEAVYVQFMLTLDNADEVASIWKNPLNVDNFSDEDKENQLKPLLSRMKPGENAFNSNFSFTIADNPNYYKFEGVYRANSTSEGTIKSIQIPKYMYLHISKMMYWLLITTNVSMATLEPPCIFKNKPIIERKVIGMTLDNTTDSHSNKQLISHFTLYYTEGLASKHDGVVVYTTKDDSDFKLLKHYITYDKFRTTYGNDVAIMPENTFCTFTPDNTYYLKMQREEDALNNIIYSIDKDTAERIGWLQWDKLIYVNKEDK